MASKASKAHPLPPTPELDKAIEHKETITTIMSFLEHLTLQKDLLLATWKPCSIDLHESSVVFNRCSESYHLAPAGGRLLALVYEYLDIDEDTMDTERLTLLNHIRLTT